MKKTRLISIYFIIGFFYVCSNITLAYGDTYVSGNITTDTIWTKANSPYIVTGTVQVLQGATLTIEPGVTIKFNIGTGLNVGHQLIAIGNEQERIIFTTNVQVPTPVPGDDLAPYCWHGIKFVDSALDAEFDANGNYLNGNIIKYCIIEYADPAIQIVGASPYIAFNKLQNNIANSGDWGGSAISIHLNPTPTTIIEHNEIENNFGLFGIIYCDQSSLKILNNKMSNNTSYSSYDNAVISLSSCNCLIQNNEITNNPRRFDSQGNPIGNCNGINVYMSSSEIKGNIINNNGGVSLSISTDANVNAYWNELYPAEPFSEYSVLINTISPVSATLHYNNLKGIYIAGCPSDIDATNNYWGTTDTSIIDSNIFDYYDDITLGKVNYQPIRNEPFKTVDFAASPLSGSYPLEVFFTDNSMGIINSLTWDFGDGGTSNKQNPSHTYTSEGTFTVSLTINRPNGSETETKSGYITVNYPFYTITATSGNGGGITPSGVVTLYHGANQTFSITPNTDYHAVDVLVDGASVGAVASYTFNNVTANHTIEATFALNPDTTPPTPNPMTWATPPYAGGTTSIAMAATVASDPTAPINYFFDFTSSPTGGTGGVDSTWQPGTSYTNTGLQANHQYGYQVKARDGVNNETGYSTPIRYVYTAIEAPTGITLGTITPTSIQAQSTNTSSGLTRGSSGLIVENTTIGTNSGWKQDNSFWSSGSLSPNTSYSFRAKARNGDALETGYCSSVSRYTQANPPGSASFSNVTQTCIRANWTANGNPAWTQYFCENTTNGTNSGWTTNLYWDNCELACGTIYAYRVKARNGDGIETGWTSLGSQSTSACPPLSGISVASPNGGETWPGGTTQTIRWSYTGNPGSNVKIELLKGGIFNSTITSSASIGRGGSGSYNWEIPSNQPSGSDYQFRVTSTSGGYYTDTSDASFTIPPPTISVVSPNGGETWAVGTRQTIRWSYTGSVGSSVKIELLKAGVVNRTITSSASVGRRGTGSYRWRIPLDLPPGSDYRIRVTSTSNSGYTDMSDNDFTIY